MIVAPQLHLLNKTQNEVVETSKVGGPLITKLNWTALFEQWQVTNRII